MSLVAIPMQQELPNPRKQASSTIRHISILLYNARLCGIEFGAPFSHLTCSNGLYFASNSPSLDLKRLLEK